MNGLEEEYNGALQCTIENARDPQSTEKIKSHGFGTHGMVIYDARDNLKQKIDGHMIEEATIRAAVKQVVEAG